MVDIAQHNGENRGAERPSVVTAMLTIRPVETSLILPRLEHCTAFRQHALG